MTSSDTTETIASYEHDGKTYEIDHLGINSPTQWGVFMIYLDGDMVVDFAIEESMLKPEFRPADLPVDTDELIELAKRAVAEAE